jgi:hypothetical protein
MRADRCDDSIAIDAQHLVGPMREDDVAAALRWYSGIATEAGAEFCELVAADTPWCAAWPRAMIAWAERLAVVMIGFRDASRRARMCPAMAMLLQAAADVAAGREAPLLTGLSSMPGPMVRSPRSVIA